MQRFFIVAAIAVLATPALAQGRVDDPLAEDMAGMLPPAHDIEAMAPVMDRALDSMLDVEVGALIDVADPYRRRPGYGRPGRTLGALGRRDDPYFEERLRDSIYDTTAGMGRMLGALSAAAPAIARSLREMESAIGTAVEDYRDRRPYRDEDYDGPFTDD